LISTSRLKPARMVLIVTIVFLFGSAPAYASGEGNGHLGLARDPNRPHAEDHVLVQIDPGRAGLTTLGQGSEDLGRGWFEIPVPSGWKAIDWAGYMSTRPGVQSAELDPLLSPQLMAPLNSNDPLYTDPGQGMYQWHLHAADVGPAWQTTVGDGVTVAVIDTGVTAGPDGFCEPFDSPRNIVTGTSGVPAVADGDGHGSHISGSIAQCTGNGLGGAGMAPGAQIMPVQVFAGESASSSDVAKGIDWARQNGAKVINLSLGCSDCDQSTILNLAISDADSAGILLVASSGNNPTDVYYPASHPSVMAVGASTITGSVASYSARGVGLDMLAPGGTSSIPIWQEVGGSYTGYSGTSMAAAHVSGAAALLRSQFKTASAAQVRNALTCSATDVGSTGWDQASGYGILDAAAAVQQLKKMVDIGALTCQGQSGAASFGVVQVNAGFWRLYLGATQVTSFYYGNPGDLGFMGDWNCDGIDTPGLYRQSDGYAYLRNSNTQGIADVSFFFGNPGDIPVAGDFNGNGCDTVSIYRPSEGKFYIINQLGSADKGLGAAEYSYYYGVPGDQPFAGDFNADGVDTPGLRRESNGFVYLRNSNTAGVADTWFYYGNAGDVVFAGDWDDDGDDTLGLYRPSNGIIYLRNSNTTGVADLSVPVGGGMNPVAGDF
jgi:Subtilase family